MEGLGQREEATDLCVTLYPQVYSAMAFYVGDRLLAEDLAQETMLRLWRERSRVSEMERPDRWALRVAFNLAKSRWHRLHVERRAHPPRSILNEESAGDLTDALAVRAAVTALPSRQRAAVVLRYFNDLSVADAASVLGCAEGTVKALTSQGIAKLRTALHVEFDVPEEEDN
jgi:RNA polymerase sigma factor (sigma-70 family)